MKINLVHERAKELSRDACEGLKSRRVVLSTKERQLGLPTLGCSVRDKSY